MWLTLDSAKIGDPTHTIFFVSRGIASHVFSSGFTKIDKNLEDRPMTSKVDPWRHAILHCRDCLVLSKQALSILNRYLQLQAGFRLGDYISTKSRTRLSSNISFVSIGPDSHDFFSWVGDRLPRFFPSSRGWVQIQRAKGNWDAGMPSIAEFRRLLVGLDKQDQLRIWTRFFFIFANPTWRKKSRTSDPTWRKNVRLCRIRRIRPH